MTPELRTPFDHHPTSPQFMSDRARCARAREGIEDPITGLGEMAEDELKERFGLFPSTKVNPPLMTAVAKRTSEIIEARDGLTSGPPAPLSERDPLIIPTLRRSCSTGAGEVTIRERIVTESLDPIERTEAIIFDSTCELISKKST